MKQKFIIMNCYIKGLSYMDALQAVSIINSFTLQRRHDLTLSLDERLSWNFVYANISIQSVAVLVATELQIEILNVLLYDHKLGSIDFDLPFLLKSPDEKLEIIQKAANHHKIDQQNKNDT